MKYYSYFNDYVKDYRENILNRRKILSALPLDTLKYQCKNELYNLILIMDYIITVKEQDIMVQIFSQYYSEIIRCQDSINLCSNRDECLEVMDHTFEKVLSPILSLLVLEDSQKVTVYWESRNSYYARLRHCNDSLQEIFEGLFEKLMLNLKTNGRKNINLLSLNEEISKSLYCKELLLGFYEAWNKKLNSKLNIYAQNKVRDLESGDHLTKKLECEAADLRISTTFDISCYQKLSHPFKETDMDSFKEYFYRLNSHINNSGIEVIIMPKINFNAEVINFLTAYLKNISIYSSSVLDYKNIIALVGQKKTKREENVIEAMQVLDSIIHSQNQKNNFQYYFSNQECDNIIFRTTFLDPSDIVTTLKTKSSEIKKFESNIMKKLYVKNDSETRHPLLPFSPGQLGLVLVSGNIDGIVDEKNGNYHVIKGSCYKTLSVNSRTENNHLIDTAIRGNGTSVQMVKADGEFVILR